MGACNLLHVLLGSTGQLRLPLQAGFWSWLRRHLMSNIHLGTAMKISLIIQCRRIKKIHIILYHIILHYILYYILLYYVLSYSVVLYCVFFGHVMLYYIILY